MEQEVLRKNNSPGKKKFLICCLRYFCYIYYNALSYRDDDTYYVTYLLRRVKEGRSVSLYLCSSYFSSGFLVRQKNKIKKICEPIMRGTWGGTECLK